MLRQSWSCFPPIELAFENFFGGPAIVCTSLLDVPSCRGIAGVAAHALPPGISTFHFDISVECASSGKSLIVAAVVARVVSARMCIVKNN